jgi:hypothetical protein
MPLPGVVRALGTLAGATALVGAGALLATKGGRPLVKQAMLAALTASERMRDLSAEAREELEDVYAEARADAAERGQTEAAAPPNGHAAIDPIPLRPQRTRRPTATSRP